MYRITHEDSAPRARGVCHQCKGEAPAYVWAIYSDHIQCVRPSGWSEYVDGHTLRFKCAACSQSEVAA